MKSKNKFKLTHKQYGIWYATSAYAISKIVSCHVSNLYNNKDLSKPFEYRDWVIEPTNDCLDDIPYKYINPTPEFIKKCWWDFQMVLEKNINED